MKTRFFVGRRVGPWYGGASSGWPRRRTRAYRAAQGRTGAATGMVGAACSWPFIACLVLIGGLVITYPWQAALCLILGAVVIALLILRARR